MKHWETLEIFPLSFHKPLIINRFKLSQLAIKTMQSHYCPWCTCQLDIFFSALWCLILTPGKDENCQKVTQKVHISHPDNFDPYVCIPWIRNARNTWVTSLWNISQVYLLMYTNVDPHYLCVCLIFGFCFWIQIDIQSALLPRRTKNISVWASMIIR